MILGDTLNQTLLDATAKVENVMMDVSRLRASFNLNLQLLQLENESFGYVQSDYREGSASYLDLVTALSDLLDAKQRYYTAYYDVLGTLAIYRYYEGTLYETLTSH